MRVLSLTCVAAFLLAGCAGGTPPAEEDLFEDVEVDTSAGKGLIRGVVIDQTITPIPGATVSIKSSDISTTSNENGLFIINDLEPGTYFLTVSKPGFASVQSSAEVKAGIDKPPVVRVQLQREPGAEPVVIPLAHEAVISCGFKAANYVFHAYYCDPLNVLGMQSADDSVHAFDVGRTDKPEHYQTEILWDATQPLSAGLVTIQCIGDSASCGSGVGSGRMCNVRGPSPLVCRISADTPANTVPGGGNNMTTVGNGAGFQGKFAIGLFSNCAVQCDPVTGVLGFGLAIDQKVSMYANLFYNIRPSEDWLFIEDGEFQVPP